MNSQKWQLDRVLHSVHVCLTGYGDAFGNGNEFKRIDGVWRSHEMNTIFIGCCCSFEATESKPTSTVNSVDVVLCNEIQILIHLLQQFLFLSLVISCYVHFTSFQVSRTFQIILPLMNMHWIFRIRLEMNNRKNSHSPQRVVCLSSSFALSYNACNRSDQSNIA